MFLVFLVTASPPVTQLFFCFVLQKNTSITSIDLSGNRSIGEEGWKAFAKALEVRFFLFHESSVFFGLPPRPCNPPVLTRFGAQVNKTVQVLNLERNKIGDEGTIALAEALKVSFVLFRECSPFSWLPTPPGNHRLWLFCLCRSTAL